METATVAFDRSEARALFREYKKHLHWSAPIDHEIRRTYQFIAQGRVVIQALESVKAAGVYDRGRGRRVPQARACRADATQCVCTMSFATACTMTPDDTRARYSLARRWRVINWRSIMSWPDGTFPVNRNVRSSRADRSCPDAAPASPPPARHRELSRSLRGAVEQGAARRSHAPAPHRQGRSLVGRRQLEFDRRREGRARHPVVETFGREDEVSHHAAR